MAGLPFLDIIGKYLSAQAAPPLPLKSSSPAPTLVATLGFYGDISSRETIVMDTVSKVADR